VGASSLKNQGIYKLNFNLNKYNKSRRNIEKIFLFVGWLFSFEINVFCFSC